MRKSSATACIIWCAPDLDIQITDPHLYLLICSHVYVRNDAVRAPLQRPYLGPFLVLQRSDKYYVLDMKGRSDFVSIDRLKPA